MWMKIYPEGGVRKKGGERGMGWGKGWGEWWVGKVKGGGVLLEVGGGADAHGQRGIGAGGRGDGGGDGEGIGG
ncbi:ribosomal protein L16, partial [Agrococcus jejuensis]|uniref:ribosomal protein L16 n=1 Tax=Agrococcus jejuensis TaxID=399736 RepID=UPI0021B5EB9B